jgi:hypothetical protein
MEDNMYNQEAAVTAIVKLAHKYNGLFHGSEIKNNGSIWLSLIFKDTVWQSKFNEKVHTCNMCKAMMNKKETCMSHILV